MYPTMVPLYQIVQNFNSGGFFLFLLKYNLVVNFWVQFGTVGPYLGTDNKIPYVVTIEVTQHQQCWIYLCIQFVCMSVANSSNCRLKKWKH